MKAAVVRVWGQAPVYADFETPSARPGHVLAEVSASALSHLARGRAAGSHYSSGGSLPMVAGVDGTGRLDDGRRVYFFGPAAPFGAMAERTVVPESNIVALPDAIDDVTAAAIAIPGMSSWAALIERARFVEGETVLVNGATGTSGRLAVQIARRLGAGRIVATGRNENALASAGADFTVSLQQDEASLRRAFEALFEQGVDVVLDYLWGPSASALLTSAARATAEGRRVRFVQIGSISAPDIALPAAVLRAAAVELMGSGLGSVAQPALLRSIGSVFEGVAQGALQVDTHAVPLAKLGDYWLDAGRHDRIVFVPGLH